MNLRAHWDAEADNWARFVRDGHDWMTELPLSRLLELLPSPGKATLDIGCGEGRFGARLIALGHTVTGVDGSPRLVELAREHHEAVVADAAALPFADASFDLAVASMSLMDIDDSPVTRHSREPMRLGPWPFRRRPASGTGHGRNGRVRFGAIGPLSRRRCPTWTVSASPMSGARHRTCPSSRNRNTFSRRG